jgi:peroxiredoxin Q/BCP
VQAIAGAPFVGEKQETEADLCDENRLRQREQLRDDRTGGPSSPEDERPSERRGDGDSQYGDGHHPMRRYHGGRSEHASPGRRVVEEGKPAPEFELESDTGETVALSSFRGRPVVLYFYPKSDTPGCTAQACGIRDVYAEFEKRGAVVLGVSSDARERQAKFKAKYGLPFTILADPDRRAGEAYGVTRPDRASFERSTFVIDRDGTVAKVMRRVDPEQHAAQVLAELPD